MTAMRAYLQGRVIAPLQENYTLLMLCMTTVVVMLGHGIISPVLPLFAESFDVQVALVGTTVGAFGLARLFVELPAGYVSERWGRRILVVGGPAITVLASVGSGLSPNLWTLLAFRFLAGAGSAMYMTGALIYLAEITDETNRGRLMSIYQGSLLLGAGSGPALGGLVAALLGYRAPFYVVGALAAFATVWAFARMPEPGRTGVNEERPARADEAAAAAQPPAAPSQTGGMADRPRAGIRDLLSRVDFWMVGLLTFTLFGTRVGARLTILPLMGDSRLGMSTWGLGLVFSMMTFLNLVILAPSGVMSDRFGRKAVIVPATLMTGLALMLFAVSNSVWMFVMAGVVLGIGAGVAGPAPAAYAADIAPPGLRGVSMGLYRTFGDMGFFVGPILAGWLADVSSFGWALGLNAALLILCALLFGLLARETVPLAPRCAQPQEV
jgi:DHA1 family multidrug resistance protein-like MFS transporter